MVAPQNCPQTREGASFALLPSQVELLLEILEGLEAVVAQRESVYAQGMTWWSLWVVWYCFLITIRAHQRLSGEMRDGDCNNCWTARDCLLASAESLDLFVGVGSSVLLHGETKVMNWVEDENYKIREVLKYSIAQYHAKHVKHMKVREDLKYLIAKYHTKHMKVREDSSSRDLPRIETSKLWMCCKWILIYKSLP